MYKISFRIISILLVLCIISSCSTSTEKVEEREKQTQDSLLALSEEGLVPLGEATNQTETEGVIGVFDVPEMLCLSIIDSANQADIGRKRANAYALLEEELKTINGEMEGSPGSIFYNNDPNNFKFECIFLLKKMPKIEPKKAEVVMLEASKMVIYNYFGSYKDLIDGYNAVRAYCKQHNLVQTAPMREFYLTDPLQEINQSKWLTRIMVPVAAKK